MIEYRCVQLEEREAYIAFTDMVFQEQGTDIYFEKALPKVYGKDLKTAELQHVAVEDVAASGTGGCASEPAASRRRGAEDGLYRHGQRASRGSQQGHMKRLTAQGMDAIRAEKVDMALSEGQRQRYEYFDFARADMAFTLPLRRETFAMR